jgi:hypothetical protein
MWRKLGPSASRTVKRKPVPKTTVDNPMTVSLYPLTLQECIICTEAKREDAYPKSGHFQRHQSCVSCIKQYIETKIKDGGVTDIRCLDTTCKASLEHDEIRKYCSKNIFARYLIYWNSQKLTQDTTISSAKRHTKRTRIFDIARIPSAE